MKRNVDLSQEAKPFSDEEGDQRQTTENEYKAKKSLPRKMQKVKDGAQVVGLAIKSDLSSTGDSTQT